MPMPKLPKPKPSETETTTTHVDSYGIEYVDGMVIITASCDVKLSRQFQSAGVSAGMQFKTKASLADDAIQKAFTKLRNALKPQIEEASNILNEV